MQSHFDLGDLRLVRAIGAEGTLTAAARRLRIDHSTAFRRLGALEARLGAGLFQRARDGYTPTPAGEAALASAERILDEVEGLEHRLAGEDLRPSGEVRITTTDTLVDLLSPLLAAFRQAHPEIAPELVVANTFFTLSKRDADIAIRPATTAPETLVGRRVSTLASAVYAASHYLERSDAQRSLSEHDWVGFEGSIGHLGSARWLAKNVPGDRIIAQASSVLALQALVRAGLGVAALPCFLGDRDPGLVRIHPPIPAMNSALWLLTHPDLRRVARIRAVLDFIGPRLTEKKRLLQGEE